MTESRGRLNISELDDWPFEGYMHSEIDPSYTRMALPDTLQTSKFRSWLSFLQIWFYFVMLRPVSKSELILEDDLAPDED